MDYNKLTKIVDAHNKGREVLKKAKSAFEAWCKDLDFECTHVCDDIIDEYSGAQAAKYKVHFFASKDEIPEIQDYLEQAAEDSYDFHFTLLSKVKRVGDNEYSFTVEID